MDVSSIRREFLRGGLDRDDLAAEPVDQFSKWFDQARDTAVPDPTAMVLATVDGNGRPSQRTVLLKYFDHRGFVFYTNYGSRKAEEIAGNCSVSLLFVWLELDRQIIINGRAARVSAADSAKYFMSRPRDSQIAAWVSSQSRRLSSRQALMQKFTEMKQKFAEGGIPLPSFWGGFRVEPTAVEFWQGRRSRLHDRFLYSRDDGGGWQIERLMP